MGDLYKQPVFRMYVDEVGKSDLASRDEPNHRFLGLTGIIMEMDYVRDIFQPKLEELKRCSFHSHPDDTYHYCSTILLERYTLFLEAKGSWGNVLAEARGGKENSRLKISFKRLYQCGTDYVKPDMIQNRLTSKELKVKPKRFNIAGLQLADLIAHPAYKDIIIRQGLMEKKETFGNKIVKILIDSK